ncbi:hypothetical protein ND861_19225, partial [Leptospira sp. 2 VSF19]
TICKNQKNKKNTKNIKNCKIISSFSILVKFLFKKKYPSWRNKKRKNKNTKISNKRKISTSECRNLDKLFRSIFKNTFE